MRQFDAEEWQIGSLRIRPSTFKQPPPVLSDFQPAAEMDNGGRRYQQYIAVIVTWLYCSSCHQQGAIVAGLGEREVRETKLCSQGLRSHPTAHFSVNLMMSDIEACECYTTLQQHRTR